MAADAIVSHLNFLLAQPVKLEIKYYDYFRVIEQSTGHVQVNKIGV